MGKKTALGFPFGEPAICFQIIRLFLQMVARECTN